MTDNPNKYTRTEILASAKIGNAMAKELFTAVKQDFDDCPNLSGLIIATLMQCAGDIYNNFDADKSKPFFFRKIAEAFSKMAGILENLEKEESNEK